MISHTIELKRDQDPIAEQLFRSIPVINYDTTSYEQLKLHLSRGEQLRHFPDSINSLEYIAEGPPLELVIIDLVPFSSDDNVRTIRKIRSLTSVPMIATTAASFYGKGRKDREEIAVLDAGADDYLAKPFPYSRLEARMNAKIRRYSRYSWDNGHLKDMSYQDGILDINLFRREVLIGGTPVKLSPTEHRLLLALTHHAGRVVSRRQLISETWGINYSNDRSLLKTTINTLRRKLAAALDPNQPELIRNTWAFGYGYIPPSP